MVPDKFNMVDMGGIDLIMMQGEEVSGLYDRLVESIAQCRYQCLYNWLFDGVVIPPSYVKMEVNEYDEVEINEGITVSSDDVIHIYSVGPSPVDPQIIPLLAEENGVYNVPSGKDGFNPVTVDVPSYTPVISPISITENGIYNAPIGVDGYSPVTVNVSGGSSSFDGSLIGEYNNTSVSAGGRWLSTGHNTANDAGYVVAYYYNSNLIKIITLKKESITSPPNSVFENIAAEMDGGGAYVALTGFNIRIINSILEVSFGAVSSGQYSAKLYTCGSAIDYFGPLYSP